MNLRTVDGFVQVQLTIEFVAGGRLSGVVDHNVFACGLASDLVGKLATAPDVDVLDSTAFLGDSFQLLLGQLLQTARIQLRIGDEHQFVLVRRHHPPPSDYSATDVPWQECVCVLAHDAAPNRHRHFGQLGQSIYEAGQGMPIFLPVSRCPPFWPSPRSPRLPSLPERHR